MSDLNRTLKERIESLGLNYVKEMIIAFSFTLISFVFALLIYFFLKELIYAGITLVIGVSISILYLSRYSSLEKKVENEHVDELVSLLSYFEIFISNGNNVYTSFRLLLPYCSLFMEDAINSLLNHIDADKTVGPYIQFASKFNNRIVESLLLSIYQMVDNGENISQFSEFDLLFSNIKEKYLTDLIDEKKKSLDFLNSFPLFGAGAITITLSMCIIQIIGEYINVI